MIRSLPSLGLVVLAGYGLGAVCGSAQTALPELIRAVKSGDAARIEQLADSKADLDVPDVQGMTPLIWAANQGKTQLVELLLSKGAAPNAADAFGWTALIHAAGAGHAATVQALLKGGATVAARTNNGVTALIAAAGHEETAKTLLAHGADPRAHATDGTTVLQAARNLGNEAVVQLVEAAVSSDLDQQRNAAVTASPPPAPPAIPEPPASPNSIPANGLPYREDSRALSANTLKHEATNRVEPQDINGAPVPPPSEVPSMPLLAEQNSVPGANADAPTSLPLDPPLQPSLSPSSEGVYLQVGTFSTASNAEQLAVQLETRGYSSVLHKRSDRYLLLVGPFPNQYSALNYRDKLQQDRFESFIARLSDDVPALNAYTPVGSVRPQPLPTENTIPSNEPLPPSTPTSRPDARSLQQNRTGAQIFLQVGAFRAEGNARTFASELGQEHKPAIQAGADGWYRVVVGPFSTRETALAYREKLSAQGRTSVLRIL